VVKVALYFVIAILILIGAFLLVQNFEVAAGRDVAPHVDMTALGVVLVVAVTAAFMIATFGRRR
jgi:phosphatidylserine synthase